MANQIDIGREHVVAYYRYLTLLRLRTRRTARDFDIETERREGWTYDNL